MIPIRFDLSQLEDLNQDLRKSVKSLPVVVQRALSVQLRELRNQMKPMVPRGRTGRLQRSFGASVRRVRGNVLATFGFMTNRRTPGGTVVAGNVLQKPGAQPKGAYLWIPTPGNRNVTPRDFYGADNTFVGTSRAGKKIGFLRTPDGGALPLFVLVKTVRFRIAPLPIEQRVEAALPEMTAGIEQTIAQAIEAKRAAIEALS